MAIENYRSVNEAADFLGISVGRVRQLVGTHESKRIRGYKVNDRAWLIPQDELEKYQKELRNKHKQRAKNNS